jgi:uncharacterized protein (TIGR03435 family)
MEPADDSALLREYAENHSEEAFAVLVSRYINLVYSIALRHVGNRIHAEEITQAVFIILAQKALRLRHDRALSSWLFQATRLTAANFVRSEARRHRRQQEAYMQTILNEPGGDPLWPGIAPLLDSAVTALSEKDRRAIMLRFYEGRDLSEVGAVLGVSEDASKKRVARALEKLQKYFFKRGVDSTTAAIAETISANSIQAAPVALAKTVTTLALAKGVTASASTLTLIKGALKIMAWTKMKTAIVAGVVVLLAAGTTTVMMRKMPSSPLDAYLKDPELNDVSNAPPMVVIQPTHFSGAGLNPGVIEGRTAGTKEIGRNIPLSIAILKAYGLDNLSRMVFPDELQRIKVDYLVTVPDHPQAKFQAEIQRQFGWTAHFETRDTDVFLLRVKYPGALGLTRADNSPWKEWSAKHPYNAGIYRHNITASYFSELVEDLVQKPVINQTGLAGNYDFITKPFESSELNQAFLNQLGLELVPTNMPIEMLVVEKVKD